MTTVSKIVGTETSVDLQKPACFAMPRTHLDLDSGTVPVCLLEESTEDLGSGVLSKDGFISAEFHQREVSQLWKKLWQMACRENDIPNIGDRIAYDIVGQSVMVVRTAADTIKAFHNACMHRGTRLLETCDSVRQITCPFHSWSWDLDGTIKHVPSRWDFPDVSNAELALSEVRCERWNGLVFVNLDKEAQPLREFIGETVLRHWEAWPRERERKVYHFAKVIPCNWKLALYTFNESYHAVGTHPQSLPFAADCSAQHDFFGPHSRFIATQGTPSAYIADSLDPQEVLDSFIHSYLPDSFPEGTPEVSEYSEVRKILAEIVREQMHNLTGVDLSAKSDTEMLDAISYNIFPNIIIYGGFGLAVIHRFRPNGQDHRSCLWEIMATASYPEGSELERDEAMVMLGPDELFADQPLLGFIGYVLDQDVTTLRKAQQGMESDGFPGPRFANYQERNLRNLSRHIAELTGMPETPSAARAS